jgi:hypothetical protein
MQRFRGSENGGNERIDTNLNGRGRQSQKSHSGDASVGVSQLWGELISRLIRAGPTWHGGCRTFARKSRSCSCPATLTAASGTRAFSTPGLPFSRSRLLPQRWPGRRAERWIRCGRRENYPAVANSLASSRIRFQAFSTWRAWVWVCPTLRRSVSFPCSLVWVRNKSPLRFRRSMIV